MQQLKTLQGIAYTFIIIALGLYGLIVAKFILAPLAFAIFFTIMFHPIAAYTEKILKNRIVAIIITLILVLIPIAALFTILSYQTVQVFENIPNISGKLRQGVSTIFEWLDQHWGVTREQTQQWLENNFSKVVDTPLTFIRKGISSSATFLMNALITTIFVFLLLLYRTSIKNFFLVQSPKNKRKEAYEIISRVQFTVSRYLYGMLMVIMILAVLNSTGLYLIGINYSIFWGSLAAILAIIPYIGTTLGGLLPFIYSIPTAEFWWQPLAVVALYSGIQSIEGNLITPNVVGSSVKINSLVAIISMIIAGYVWGIAGIVLALPVVAIIKLFFDHTSSMKGLALLLSDKLHKKSDVFFEELDHDRYRISNWFKKE